MREPGWITKAEAAALNNCDPRTIERKAAAGKIASRARQGFPTLYWQADVAKLRETSPGDVHTGILEAVPPASSNGHGALATDRQDLARSLPTADDPIRQLAAAFRAFLLAPIGPTGPTLAPTGPTPETLWVDVEEAAGLLGWELRDVRKAVRSGELEAHNKHLRDWHRWRIRRSGLKEAL